MAEFSIHDNFDFTRTYSEYGVSNPEELVSLIEHIFFGVKKIMFLHNCIVVRTTNFGVNLSDLIQMKEEMKETLRDLDICIATFSPWTGNDNYGLVYNIFLAENCCPVKYPI